MEKMIEKTRLKYFNSFIYQLTASSKQVFNPCCVRALVSQYFTPSFLASADPSSYVISRWPDSVYLHEGSPERKSKNKNKKMYTVKNTENWDVKKNLTVLKYNSLILKRRGGWMTCDFTSFSTVFQSVISGR